MANLFDLKVGDHFRDFRHQDEVYVLSVEDDGKGRSKVKCVLRRQSGDWHVVKSDQVDNYNSYADVTRCRITTQVENL